MIVELMGHLEVIEIPQAYEVLRNTGVLGIMRDLEGMRISELMGSWR